MNKGPSIAKGGIVNRRTVAAGEDVAYVYFVVLLPYKFDPEQFLSIKIQFSATYLNEARKGPAHTPIPTHKATFELARNTNRY